MRTVIWCILFLSLIGSGCVIIMHSENTEIDTDTSVQGATVNL